MDLSQDFFFDIWDPGAGRLFRDFFKTLWLLAPRRPLPGPWNLNASANGRNRVGALGLEALRVLHVCISNSWFFTSVFATEFPSLTNIPAVGHFARAAANGYTLRKQISPDARCKMRTGAFVLNTSSSKALTCSRQPLAMQLVLNQLPFDKRANHRRESHLGPLHAVTLVILCGEQEHAGTLDMLFRCTDPAILIWRAQLHPLIAPSLL